MRIPIFQCQFFEIARQSKTLCDKYKVPLVINDRVDIALAVQADGVHLGQTDMPVHVARTLLPPNAIIGVSCNNLDHLKKAVEDRVDYIGIGAVWITNTKELTNPVIGVRGVGSFLSALDGTDVKAVAIGTRHSIVLVMKGSSRTRPPGGIKSDNFLRTLHGSVSPSGHRLDGVAVVSEIVASRDPYRSARTLREAYTSWSAQLANQEKAWSAPMYTTDSVKAGVIGLIRAIRDHNPLVHQVGLSFSFPLLFSQSHRLRTLLSQTNLQMSP